ncbi:MAG: HNH endonuclease [Proteobacteria bacterium]|nr:HNH endonuclease [Pseudomonadota bacterium]
MTKRQSLSPMKRLKVFEAAGGVCHLCGQRIQAGQKWDVEHRIPLALGGPDDEANMSPSHKACHVLKSVDDFARISKAKRQKIKHFGARKPSTFPKPPPGYVWDWKRSRYTKEIA